MEKMSGIIVSLALAAGLLRVVYLPLKLIWKLLINSACGFLCLWLLNTLSGFTGIAIPLNPVTTAVAGFLGLPGMVLLILAEVFQ